MVFCKHNFYQMSFIKVHGVDATHLTQSLIKQETLKFWHCWLEYLNVKIVHLFQSIVSGMDLGEMTCLTLSLEIVQSNVWPMVLFKLH